MNGKEKMDFLTNNFDGIGPQRAQKIIDTFPEVENLLYLRKANDAETRMRTILPTNAAKMFWDQIEKMLSQKDDIHKMMDCGIAYLNALIIVNNEHEFKNFLNTPYIYAKNHGIPFEACDKYIHMIAGENSPDMTEERMIHFMDAMLLNLEQSGHTFAYMAQLLKKMNSYQTMHQYVPNFYQASTLLLYLFNGTDMFDVTPHKNPERYRIYRKETADLEINIAYHIKRLSVNAQLFDNAVFESNGLKYDKVQLGAIESANLSGLKVITGPPGSGKTAVINGIINFFKSLKPNAKILCCAPTGRAAKHMSEITGEPASTIHKMLGIRMGSTMTKKEKLDCDILICDEASMLNLDITYELLSHINTGTVVYFVGDKDQLPAVGPGNVLHDIINSKQVPTYKLTKVYRQDGIILNNAHKINKGIVPTEFSDKYTTEVFDSAEKLREKTLEWFELLYNPDEPFETQIIIPSYQTECGIMAINKAIQANNPEDFVYIPKDGKGYSYKKNDKILMIKNDKDGQYQNGSVGVLLAHYGNELEVDFEGTVTMLPATAVNDMSLGYAISVHKSQGSEYKHVIMCLPQEPEVMLKRNIFYTGATRAKQDLHVLAMTDTIEKAVGTSMELFMQTGLKEALCVK